LFLITMSTVEDSFSADVVSVTRLVKESAKSKALLGAGYTLRSGLLKYLRCEVIGVYSYAVPTTEAAIGKYEENAEKLKVLSQTVIAELGKKGYATADTAEHPNIIKKMEGNSMENYIAKLTKGRQKTTAIAFFKKQMPSPLVTEEEVVEDSDSRPPVVAAPQKPAAVPPQQPAVKQKSPLSPGEQEPPFSTQDPPALSQSPVAPKKKDAAAPIKKKRVRGKRIEVELDTSTASAMQDAIDMMCAGHPELQELFAFVAQCPVMYLVKAGELRNVKGLEHIADTIPALVPPTREIRSAFDAVPAPPKPIPPIDDYPPEILDALKALGDCFAKHYGRIYRPCSD